MSTRKKVFYVIALIATCGLAIMPIVLIELFADDIARTWNNEPPR